MTSREEGEITETGGGNGEPAAADGGNGGPAATDGGGNGEPAATGGGNGGPAATDGGGNGGPAATGGGIGGLFAAGRRKILLWAGAATLIVVAVVVVVVVVLLVLVRGGSLPTGPLGLLPDDVSWVVVSDVELIMAGDATDDAADDFEDAWEDRLEDIGVFLDDLDTIVQAQGGDGSLTVVAGELDFEQIRDDLDDADYDDDSYQGYEIWEEGDLWIEAVALLEGRDELVIGSLDAVEGVLRSLDRSDGSLLQDDDNDIRRVLERVGPGWQVYAFEGCQGADVRGCEAAGGAASRGSESYLVEGSLAFLFRNERTADSEMDDLEDYLDDEFHRDVDIEEVRTDGVFVIVTTSVDEDDWRGLFP